MSSGEEWRRVARNHNYEVSNLGRVRRAIDSKTHKATGRPLKTPLRGGYPSVDLCLDGQRTTTTVHELVAETFLGQRPTGAVVNHIDSDRTNNRPENLEYTTQARNVQQAYNQGRRDCRGSGNGFAKLDEASVAEIKRRLLEGARQVDLARTYGVTDGAIRAIASGRSWARVPAADGRSATLEAQ